MIDGIDWTLVPQPSEGQTAFTELPSRAAWLVPTRHTVWLMPLATEAQTAHAVGRPVQDEHLGGEVTDDVGHVSTPEGADALLLSHAGKAIDDTLVAGQLTGLDLGVRVLCLEEQLHALNGGDHGLGDGTGDTTGSQVLGEGSCPLLGCGRCSCGLILSGGGNHHAVHPAGARGSCLSSWTVVVPVAGCHVTKAASPARGRRLRTAPTRT